MSTINQPEAQVYAPKGSETFNQKMYETLADLTDETVSLIGDNLVALLLSGGYGRGEGGVNIVNGKEWPHNDLDLTIIVQRRDHVLKRVVEHITNRYGKRLGVRVDFNRPITLKELRRLPHWLVWHDLLAGHQVLYGPSYILSVNMPKYMKDPVPGTEALHLLLNRGAGLLRALRMVRQCEPELDRDFIRQNYFKTAMALGDAVLIMLGHYDGRHQIRHERLIGAVQADHELQKFDLLPLHEDGIHFKFTPHDFDAREITEDDLRDLARRWCEVFLWCERQRTGGPFEDTEVYCRWPGIREKDRSRLRHMPRNFARNLRVGWMSFRHPRESLYRMLPQLLDVKQMDYPEWPAIGEEFLKAWRRYS